MCHSDVSFGCGITGPVTSECGFDMSNRLASCLVFCAMLALLCCTPLAWAANGQLGASSVEGLAGQSGANAAAPALTDCVAEGGERAHIGGGGALFYPRISPHNPRDMAVGTDMGDVYISHDAGATWAKKNVGQIYDIAYDPVDPGRVYTGGFGLWRSSDSGDAFERLWPRNITGEYTSYESRGHYLANTDGYRQGTRIYSIAIDPDDNTRIHVLVMNGYTLEIWRSVDDGATFQKLATHPLNRYGVGEWEDNKKLVVHDGAVRLCTQAGVFEYDEAAGALVSVYEPAGGYKAVIDVDQVRSSSGDLYYWVCEALEDNVSGSITSLRRTQDFVTFDDLTGDMNDESKGLSRTAAKQAGAPKFDIRIRELAGATPERVYFRVLMKVNGTEYNDLGRYDGGPAYASAPFRWIYGLDFDANAVHTRFDLQNMSHADGYFRMWGIAADANHPNSFLLTTGFGVYASSDCEVAYAGTTKRSNIYQRYAAVTTDAAVKWQKETYASNGIDNVTTYGMRIDPFDPSHVALMNTDFGLTISKDGGATWSRFYASYGSSLPEAWMNTAYDFEFDRYLEGRVYSLWSSRHDVPYSTRAEDASAQGGFAKATMTDATWAELSVPWEVATDGSALPSNAIPVKMDIVYPAGLSVQSSGDDRTIWVACFNDGFYRSTDSGETFSAVNAGLTTENGAADSNGLIFAADVEASEDGSRVFGILARRTHGGNAASGRVVELGDDGAWRTVPLPADVTCPRDLTWDEATSTLYISCCADNVANPQASSSDFSVPSRLNVGGGVYVWHPGDAAATALDAASSAVGSAASIEGTDVDGAGNLFASDLRGAVWLRRMGSGEFERVTDYFHGSSKDVQVIAEAVGGDGTRTDTICLPSFGGGLMRKNVVVNGPMASEDDPAEDSPSGETDNGNQGEAGGKSANAPAGGATGNAASNMSPDAPAGGAGVSAENQTGTPRGEHAANRPAGNAQTSQPRSGTPPTGDPLPALALVMLIMAASAAAIIAKRRSSL